MRKFHQASPAALKRGGFVQCPKNWLLNRDPAKCLSQAVDPSTQLLRFGACPLVSKCSKLFNIIDDALNAMHATGGIDALIEVYGLSELYPVLKSLRAEGCDEMLIEEAFDRPSCTSLRTRDQQVLAELENSPLYNKLDSSQAMYILSIATERARVAQCFLEAPEGHIML